MAEGEGGSLKGEGVSGRALKSLMNKSVRWYIYIIGGSYMCM